MKRFQVFAGSTYYPSGGWSDWHSEHDSLEAVTATVTALIGPEKWAGTHDWAQIVDVTQNPPVKTDIGWP